MPVGFPDVSGLAVNCNKEEGVFDITPGQYISHYKTNRPPSVLPIHA